MTTKKPLNILVFPGGTEVGLEIWRSLRYCKEVQLYSAASNVKEHSAYVYENSATLPMVSETGCIDELLLLIEKWSIDCIYPANPIVMDFLQKVRHRLPCRVAMASNDCLCVTRSKAKTYEALSEIIPTPKLYLRGDVVDQYPIVIKPDAMYGSQGFRIIESAEALALSPPNCDDLVCEFLPGDEFTIDCFSTAKGGLVYSRARSRERVRMGTSMHCEAADESLQKIFSNYASLIQKKLSMWGGWFFQMKADENGVYRLLEVESRIAGSMAFNRALGINFALLSILDLYGVDVAICNQKMIPLVMDRSLVNRFNYPIDYDHVYVDLDDTLVIKGKLNLELIQFLYQCINAKKRLVLITKSLELDLKEYLIGQKIYHIFDEIHALREVDSKADYMHSKYAIYIDDSFSQRMEVQQRKGYLTFDPSMVEVLIDSRSS